MGADAMLVAGAELAVSLRGHDRWSCGYGFRHLTGDGRFHTVRWNGDASGAKRIPSGAGNPIEPRDDLRSWFHEPW